MAEIKCSYDTNRKRLGDIVPLASPLSMYIEPTKKCNFKCFYCMHSTRDREDGEFARTGYECADIDPGFYSKIVRDIMNFPEQPKRICFSGLGDPLMNRRLPEMVKELRDAGFSERIDVITNGYALTNEMADALTEAGISRVQISIQGLDTADYLENCGVAVDFEKLVGQIQYLHEHKGDSVVYIKIIDAMLTDERKKEAFFRIFSPFCDQIFIEHLIVMEQQMGDHGNRVDGTRNLNNEEFVARDICPVSFYHMQVSCEGHTFPCPVPGMPSRFSMGNAKEKTLREIWESDRRKNFLKIQLRKERYSIDPCGSCVACAAVMDENENLDDVSEKILEKMEGV